MYVTFLLHKELLLVWILAWPMVLSDGLRWNAYGGPCCIKTCTTWFWHTTAVQNLNHNAFHRPTAPEMDRWWRCWFKSKTASKCQKGSCGLQKSFPFISFQFQKLSDSDRTRSPSGSSSTSTKLLFMPSFIYPAQSRLDPDLYVLVCQNHNFHYFKIVIVMTVFFV